MGAILLALFVAISISVMAQWVRADESDTERNPLAVAFWRGAFWLLVAMMACVGAAAYLLVDAAGRNEGNAFGFVLLLLAALCFLLMAGVGFVVVWIKALKARKP